MIILRMLWKIRIKYQEFGYIIGLDKNEFWIWLFLEEKPNLRS